MKRIRVHLPRKVFVMMFLRKSSWNSRTLPPAVIADFPGKKGGAGAGTDAGTGIYAAAVERWPRPLGEPQQARVRRRAQRVGGAQPGHESGSESGFSRSSSSSFSSNDADG